MCRGNCFFLLKMLASASIVSVVPQFRCKVVVAFDNRIEKLTNDNSGEALESISKAWCAMGFRNRPKVYPRGSCNSVLCKRRLSDAFPYLLGKTDKCFLMPSEFLEQKTSSILDLLFFVLIEIQFKKNKYSVLLIPFLSVTHK